MANITFPGGNCSNGNYAYGEFNDGSQRKSYVYMTENTDGTILLLSNSEEATSNNGYYFHIGIVGLNGAGSTGSASWMWSNNANSNFQVAQAGVMQYAPCNNCQFGQRETFDKMNQSGPGLAYWGDTPIVPRFAVVTAPDNHGSVVSTPAMLFPARHLPGLTIDIQKVFHHMAWSSGGGHSGGYDGWNFCDWLSTGSGSGCGGIYNATGGVGGNGHSIILKEP